MRYVLSPPSVETLKLASQHAILCAFDFDGTLSPIVPHPDAAGMRTRTHTLLSQLAALYPCVIVSGRSRADVLSKLEGINVARVIGNHGAETETPPQASLDRVCQWKLTLVNSLKGIPGLWIEDKGLSLAVHYRQSPDKSQARRSIIAAARKLDGVHLIGGKRVVNLVDRTAPNKGDALAAERTRLGCDWLLYAGDDENDEDAFALNGSVISIRIGRRQRSHARYFLRAQSEIDTLLELLIQLRQPSAPA
jgi:trehalose 6-phosphate phosphatase